MCWSSLVELCMSIQCRVYLQSMFIPASFFIIKVYFPNLNWVGHENFFIQRWVTEPIGKICDLPPAHPSSYFMTSPLTRTKSTNSKVKGACSDGYTADRSHDCVTEATL
jgi:hypothetical protein